MFDPRQNRLNYFADRLPEVKKEENFKAFVGKGVSLTEQPKPGPKK